MNKAKALSRLYCIVDKGTLDARGVRVADFARELCGAGVRLVQYRDKTGGPQEILRGAAEVAEAFAGVDAALVMNDRADLAALMGWGVHVGQGDLPVEAAKAVVRYRERYPTLPRVEGWSMPDEAGARRGWGTRSSVEMTGLLVGVSTHDEEQVRVADVGVADYVAVGPVFATSTKLNAEPVVGLEGVRRARALTVKPLVAIGGITLENARSVIEAGADSVAVIGGLFVAGRSVGDVARDFLERLR